MRRALIRVSVALVTALASLVLAAGPAAAHPMDPPGGNDQAPEQVPAADPGHEGIQCGAEKGGPPGEGHPVFPDLSLVFDCPA